ncbi:MAG: ATP-binding protein [Eubacterium sp.]|nr:ATP-binding protein [Eubacterium sp.]
MSYPSAYYDEAQRVIDKRRFDNSLEENRRAQEINDKLPAAAELVEQLAGTIDKLAKIILDRDENVAQRVEKLKEENLSMQDKLAELLTKNGYPADYLDEIYTCQKCKDTGIGENGRCECFHELLRQIAAKKLSESLPIGLSTFDSFELKYYSDIKDPKLGGLSPRNIMEQNLRSCEKYAENFHLPYESVFMSGGTGLGKTHLSLAIAKKVIEKEYSVVYGSVPDLLRRIETAHFDRREDDADVIFTVKECDLLVLDDLGAEFSTQFYISTLYDIINTRLNFGRPTIVSTNLTSEELVQRYTDRIASRLLSMKRMLFVGSDIRVSKRS